LRVQGFFGENELTETLDGVLKATREPFEDALCQVEKSISVE
jgi:hypothetical protein